MRSHARTPGVIALLIAGIIVSVLSLTMWAGRSVRTQVSGPPGAQVGSEFEVLAPAWPGVLAGALIVGAALWFLIRPQILHTGRLKAVVLAFMGMIVSSAWLLTFLRLRDLGGWSDGRPVRSISGRAILPELATLPAADRLSPVAKYWIEAARHEESSVSSFERLTQELERVGAPPTLIAKAASAADDERVHARVCLRVAAMHTDVELPALRSPEESHARPLVSPTRLAVEAFTDGVIGEGFATERLLRAATDPTVSKDQAKAMLSLARDERRHVALAMETIQWCLRYGDRRVRRGLRRAARKVPSSSPYPEELVGVQADILAAGGLLTDDQASQAWTAVTAHGTAWLRARI